MAIELELTPLNIIAASFGTFLLAYGALSHFIKERLYLGEAPFALLFGIALQHYGVPGELKGAPGHGADPLDAFGLGLSRFIIGIQLVLVGVQLPYKYPKTEWRSLAVLLLPVMTLMWGMTTLVTWLTLPDVPVLVALVIAAAVTPTDPVLSSAIVKGSFADQYVSPRIRNLISAESGANDGFALPFMFIAACLLKEDTPAAALKSWVLETCLWSVCGSVVLGAALGFGANRLLQLAASKHLIDKESFLLYAMALGVLIVGLGGILATDDLLACFVAGNALTWDDWYRRETEDDELQNVTDLICNSLFFTFVGATMPWAAFNDPAVGLTHGNLALLCVGVLFLRRVPAMMLFYRVIPQIADSGEALFMGWMAPIGAGSIFYTFLILEEFKAESDNADDLRIRALVKPVIYALVLSSIVAHTLMVPVIKLGFEFLGIESIKMYEPAPGEGSLAGGNESSEQAEDDAYESGAGPAPGSPEHSARNRFSQLSEGAQQQAEEQGAYLSSGKYDPHPSWRISSGHKLGPHVVTRGHDGHDVQQADFQPSAWQRNRLSRGSLRGAPRGADYGSLEEGGGGGNR